MDLSIATLRTIRAVAERRSFTAAADALGFTQSAVSRQVAAAERELRVELFERLPRGVRLTRAGSVALHQFAVALDALDDVERQIRPGARARVVRVGAFAAAHVCLVPAALGLLRRSHRELGISTREGTTPSLVRALRAGTLDFAVVSARPPYRAPDRERPVLPQLTLSERPLALAVPPFGRLAGTAAVTVESLEGEAWIATPGGNDDSQLGVWPGLPGRPQVRHWTRDWATKLALVAEGAGVTTVPAELLPTLTDRVHLTAIDGVPQEWRRLSLAHGLQVPAPVVDAVSSAFATAMQELETSSRARSRRP